MFSLVGHVLGTCKGTDWIASVVEWTLLRVVGYSVPSQRSTQHNLLLQCIHLGILCGQLLPQLGIRVSIWQFHGKSPAFRSGVAWELSLSMADCSWAI